MSTDLPDPGSPWHIGEKTLQARLGVAETMEVFGRRVIRDHLPDQHRDFYRQLPFLIVGSVDAEGRAWASVLEGPPGFLNSPDPRTLAVQTAMDPQDPAFANLQTGAGIGLLGIELHSRRRNRMNGQVQTRDAQSFSIAVEQTFGNCPQYIQLRHGLEPARTLSPIPRAEVMAELDDRARAMIAAADTFFVASYLPRESGAAAIDVSHRGGQVGFVQVDGNRLSIPDFAGNLHFNTLGNLLVNPRAGLLFIDFNTGDLLQISGRTELTLEGPEIDAFQGAERLWHVIVEQVIRRPGALALRWQFEAFSPNSLMTGSWAEARSRLQAESLREQWRPVRVVGKEFESDQICSFYLQPDDGAAWPPFVAGQHLLLRLQLPGETRAAIRAYSVSSAPADTFLRISVKRDGRASAYLHEQMQVGSVLSAKAPRGEFVLDADARRPVVLLAAGVGITPLLSMLREVVYQNARLRRRRPVLLLQSARRQQDLAFAAEIKELLAAQADVIRHLRILSQPEPGLGMARDYDHHGRLDRDFLSSLAWPEDADYFICGPASFTQDLYDLLRERAVPDDRIHAETFGPSSLRRSALQSESVAVRLPATQPVAVMFQRSGKEARWTPQTGSLLDLAEQRGLSPEFSCRGGSCGACATRLVQGQVAYERPISADPGEERVLICCAVPAANPGATPLVLDL